MQQHIIPSFRSLPVRALRFISGYTNLDQKAVQADMCYSYLDKYYAPNFIQALEFIQHPSMRDRL